MDRDSRTFPGVDVGVRRNAIVQLHVFEILITQFTNTRCRRNFDGDRELFRLRITRMDLISRCLTDPTNIVAGDNRSVPSGFVDGFHPEFSVDVLMVGRRVKQSH